MRKMIISQAVCLGAGLIGAVFSMQSLGTWYDMLKKPLYTPPNWVFAPVWTVLYVLMGLALYLIWHKRQGYGQKTVAYLLFAAQLTLNVGWTFIFFVEHALWGGLFVILGLWLSIVATIHEFLKISQVAGWLLLPYLIWVSYAALLNLGLCWFNK